MNMGFYEKCRNCAIIQMAVFTVCCVGNASGSTNIAQGCVGSRLDLHCSSTKNIKQIKVEQGVSECKGIRCCIKDAGCPKTPSEEHVKLIHQECQDRQHCTVEIQFVDSTPCSSGWLLGKTTVDGHAFERITYSCEENMVTSTVGTNAELGNKTETGSMNETRPSYDNRTSIEYGNNEINSTEADGKVDTVPAMLPVVLVILILVILVAIVSLVVFMHRRKLFAQVKVCDSVAMTKIVNRQNETNVTANEDPGTTVYSCVGPADEADYTPTEDDPSIYSEVEQRKLVSKNGQGSRVATDKTIAAAESHTAGLDVYIAVIKPLKAPATSSALKTDQMGGKGVIIKDDRCQDQIYSLASNDSEDIYVNEPTVVSTKIITKTKSKTTMPQDDVGQTVIENDLYCH